MSSLTILYGTQTGTSEALAFRLARYALLCGCAKAEVYPADEIPVSQWPSLSPIIILCSNSNQGEAPLSFRKTWECLLDVYSAPDLDGLFYAVFGVGDSLYAKFNFMGKMLHNRLKQLHATPLILRGLGDESDRRGLEEALEPWLIELWEILGWGHVLESKKHRKIESSPSEAEVSRAAAVTSLHHLSVETLPFFPLYSVQVISRASEGTHRAQGGGFSTQAPSNGCRHEHHFVGEIIENSRLTASDHYQAVHHLEMKLFYPPNSPIETVREMPALQVGDAIGVFVDNPRSLVDRALDVLRWTGEEVVQVNLFESSDRMKPFIARHSRFYGGEGVGVTPTKEGGCYFLSVPHSVREVLQRFIDLEAVVPQDFLWMLARLLPPPVPEGSPGASNPKQMAESELRERLVELADPGCPDEYLSYAYREKRNVVEVLEDFKHHPAFSTVGLEWFLSFAPLMRPRFFSISSSPSLDDETSNPKERRCHLTVGQLSWVTPLKRQREGLCSTALATASRGSQFECILWKGSLVLPSIPLPLICIAAGTGVAAVRGLLREWSVMAKADAAFAAMPVYLFFGCRYASKDYIYEAEWKALKASSLPQLHVIPAFSRDTPVKVYVQHQMAQHAKALGALFNNSNAPPVVYLCGNAKQLPRDVENALIQIVAQTVYGGAEEAAALYLKTMRSEGRYQVETWSS